MDNHGTRLRGESDPLGEEIDDLMGLPRICNTRDLSNMDERLKPLALVPLRVGLKMPYF